MKNHQEIEILAAQWLAREEAGEWSEREQAELDEWLANDSAHKVAWLRLRAAWKLADDVHNLASQGGDAPGLAQP